MQFILKVEVGGVLEYIGPFKYYRQAEKHAWELMADDKGVTAGVRELLAPPVEDGS